MNRIESKTKTKRSVTNKSKTKSRVKNTTSVREYSENSPIKFDFTYYRPFSVKNSFFTNFYSTVDDYVKMQNVFIESILFFSQFRYEELMTKTAHSHKIENDKKRIVDSIIDLYEISSINGEIKEKNIYQLGQSNGLRIIGYIDTISGVKYFYPLFIDPHHLIYSNKYYNDKDTDKYSYSNIKKCVDKTKLTLIDFDSVCCDGCYNCKSLDNVLNK